MSVFSKRLVELINIKGLSQKDFAKMADITESAASYYLKGMRTPSGEILVRISKALDTTTDYLLGRTDNIKQSETQGELRYLQRNLGKLDDEQLKKAEEILKLVFDDIFEENNNKE